MTMLEVTDFSFCMFRLDHALIATVWLIPETDSAAGANIKLKSRRVIGSVVTAQRVRVVSLSGVSSHMKRNRPGRTVNGEIA